MTNSAPPPAASRSCWKLVLLALAILVLALAALWWWHNRPIKPVELSATEKTTLEEKLQTARLTTEQPEQPETESYQKGGKEIIITERELNGLLNEHTGLGDRLRFELVPGALHAKVVTDLDPDLPLLGGRKLNARARFFIETRDGVPELILDDLTVWGLSLPNEWLGGLKGQNLLGKILGGGSGSTGIASLQVEAGRLLITLKE